MEIKTTPIEGLLEITPKVFPDNRGWFIELYKNSLFAEVNPSIKFVQENLSFSKKGVIRGLHLQLEPFAQAKLVTVVHGKILDVVVDLRKGSNNFGNVFKCILDGENHKMLYVPEGFAHGFSALEDSYFYYKCTNTYSPKHETGIRWNDSQLNIDWEISNPIISEKDQGLPSLEDLLIKSVISPE
ncbi:MAG: dTDP-4-dehydrorhamnose 3,5-epimerase [Cyclobacteriaceae bacterium]|nr:dTDP-4-dehydrorhamnose 3,5-epimerase [Cyclobacteriaceae bacterium]